MCGIAGVISATGHSQQSFEGMGAAMLNHIRYRGPDDEGMQLIKGAKLQGVVCHARLSILGLGPEGHQPMVAESQRFVLAFNGEIFNFKELRIAHELPYKTHTDTETLLLLWEKFGEQCLPWLDGFFAFAIWDTQEEKCYLVKDRTGVKPLYFSRLMGGDVAFASDERAIVQLLYEGGVSHGVTNPDYWIAYQKGFSDKVNLYQDMHSVKSGTFVEIIPSTDGLGELNIQTKEWFKGRRLFEYEEIKLQTEQSWKSFASSSASDSKIEKILSKLPEVSEKAECLRKQLFMSIARRLQSEVPLGFALSGGIDSSAITAIAARLLEHPQQQLQTFSVRSLEFSEDESKWQQRMVDFLGTTHRFIDTADFGPELLPEFIEKTGRPPLHWNNLAHFELCKVVKSSGVTVLFNGQGADEIFAGYPHYYSQQLFSEWTALLPHRKKWPISVISAFKQQVKFWYKHKRALTQYPLLFETQLSDYYGDRLTQLLRFEDRNGMANQLESRNPFADDFLLAQWIGISQMDAEFETSDWGYLVGELSGTLFNGYSKGLLRESMQGILPEEVLFRTDKKGFTVPHEFLTWKHLSAWEEIILEEKDLDIIASSKERAELYRNKKDPQQLFRLAALGYYFKYLRTSKH